MASYNKTFSRRYALWRAYDMKCFYCRMPVEFMSVTIDHVLPKSLANDEKALSGVLSEYQIKAAFPSFGIDDLTNLVPAHAFSCNGRKSNELLPKQTIHFYLGLVKKQLPKVVKELGRLQSSSWRGNVLGQMAAALEAGDVTADDITKILQEINYRQIERSPLVATFGLNWMETAEIRQFNLKEDGAYAILCDKLESELVQFLRENSTYSFHYPEESQRTGETLSVRLVFPEVDLEGSEILPLFAVEHEMPWWQLLEIDSFQSIYGVPYREAMLS